MTGTNSTHALFLIEARFRARFCFDVPGTTGFAWGETPRTRQSSEERGTIAVREKR
ncbi:MAG TPA: hypothetical protein VM118_12295 [Acidobacteriota bacterium]|nr:hypothetical protein [Acidobacteriota bacterium]